MSFRASNRISVALAAFSLLTGSAAARADLIAYWNFNGPGSGVPGTPNLTVSQGNGTLVNGPAPDAFPAANFGSFTGSAINALNGDPAGVALAFQGGTGNANNGKKIRFEISTLGFQGLVMTFATQDTSTGFHSNQVAYSTDGTNYTNVGDPYDPAISFALHTVNFPPETDNQTTLYVQITFGGATGATGNNRIDNVQFNAEVFIIGGACCDGVSCTFQTQAACEGASGIYQGNDTVCSPNPCTALPSGACCDPATSACSVTTPDVCALNSANYQGDGSACSPSPCPPAPTGACCVNGVCSVRTLLACNSSSGTYVGDGSACGAFVCPCMTATEARAVSLGAGVSICNVTVTSVTDLVSSTSSKTIHVQDASGTLGVRGITVFGSNNAIDTIDFFVNVGDTLTLYGSADSFNGLFEIADTANNPLATSNIIPGPPPVPYSASLADLQPATAAAEQLESVLIRSECVTFVDSGTFTGLTNYVVQAGTNTVVVRVATADLDLVGQPIPTGPVRITGIFSQFDNAAPFDDGYQLLPRGIADIEECASSGCTSCPGNFDGQPARDGRDLQGFLNCYLANVGGAPASGCECVDMNSDQLVDLTDITDASVGIVATLLGGTSCP